MSSNQVEKVCGIFAAAEYYQQQLKPAETRHNQERTKHMKTTKNLLIALSAVTLLSLTGNANAQATGADGITASPKGRQFLNEMVKGTPSTTVAYVGYQATGRDGITASPKLRQIIDDSRGVASTGSTTDFAHAPRPTLSPKDPRYEAAWRANAERKFQIAPVK